MTLVSILFSPTIFDLVLSSPPPLSPQISPQSWVPRQWQRLNLEHRSGADIFEALFSASTIATLLESPDRVDGAPSQLIRYSLCAGAPRQMADQPRLFTPAIGEILPTLAILLQTSRAQALGIQDPDSQTPGSKAQHSNPWVAPTSPASPPDDLPFLGGWLGWLGFDTAWEIETLPYLKDDSLPFPVAYWYEPEQFAILDHQQQHLWLAALSLDDLDTMVQCLNTPDRDLPALQTPPSSNVSQVVTLHSEQNAFETAVQQAKDHIRAGDVFQVNLSLRFETQTSQSPWQLYRQLHQINPSPFASYWCTPWGHVISCSPERLVQLSGQTAQTRPIAGTRPRGHTPAADRQLAQTLQSNRKEQAEHIMLVDLERNDLGRVCTWGSIQVDELMVVERYSHVMHLVSNVMGTLRPDQTAIDLIRATFPGGTITGCPKVRCMEIIETLEPLRRSLFYGSCGYLDVRGNLDLNILIRTLLLAPSDQASDPGSQTVWGQVGAGIVADSDPHQEWLESLQKAQAQLLALGVSI
ncbi:anthranilate synthase component I [Leptothoe sp. PORK10 BA2]|uniref:anthranilate synthase component I n=1 Tax=Leptothoe sp. PORK10 BA2 TaxID=3110254 RepID=UPI002B1FDD19|nr:anthranilate synthase component I [Leptothoe sp. PORK10 BA2]MEA5466384.1 anthranilate synthase component I [Leptothoe sp. PORK10 BA2]